MAICAGISTDIVLQCDTPPVAGVADVMYLINKADIDTVTFDNTNPTAANKLVTDITLKAGKFAYKVEGRNNSHEPSSLLRKGRYFDTFEHQVMFKIFDNSPAIKTQIENMVQRGDLVAIVENNFRGVGDVAAFEILGYGSGLEVTEQTRVTNDQDTQGGYSITLKTGDQQGEPHLPYSLLDTNYATTVTLLEGLLDT